MNTTYTIDLTLKPTTFDLWHVCLAGTVALLAILLIVLLIVMLIGIARGRKKLLEEALRKSAASLAETVKIPEPEVKVVEKIVEVEKVVQAPAPEPVVLKEATPDAALQLLSLLQKEARFIDFIKEDITAYNDADIGVAARVVHEGCNKAINEHFKLVAVHEGQEGNKVTLPKGFDAASIRLTGNIVGEAPFTGTLIHRGWQAAEIRLPKLTAGHNAKIIAPAEVEL
ncbi:DUF2760 domain-containing protein [Methylotuvimicrobium alcaliphilum]|uniref:DUF2760 domain-containing protein n=1 Tax=Methylotuvimicrobium alcaliphilum (strain DSM 19304 / NCIMB 14124 / VKM B-2133 / 20Z) TaxID=1091494 RepID=G4STZ5_META2|nr:DUF2760 domain-containing protein [Methylotuvimicrobium alcaliphilum]CCE22818.1 conserved protein of unknown function [Methylotuvimicrobium alcaliphilum 20Z]